MLYIVDDDSDFSELVEAVASELGFACERFDRGAKLEQALVTLRPTAMVVDGLLPDGTGVDLLESLAKTSELPPTLFLSAFFHKREVTGRLERIGVAMTRRKPISIEALSHALAELAPPPTETLRPAGHDVARRHRGSRDTYIDQLPSFATAVHNLRSKVQRDRSAVQSVAALAQRVAGMAGAHRMQAVAALAGEVEAHIAGGADTVELDRQLFELAIAMEAAHAKLRP